jgi:hypothetical protein
MTRTPRFLSILLVLLVSGCGGIPFFSGDETSEPATVQESSEAGAGTAVETTGSPGEPEDGVALSPYRQATVGSPAVEELLQRAASQQAEGNRVEAVATVERALRIEPRNARLWNRLAHLRAEQRQAVLAADLAAKSNTLAGDDPELKRDNWRLIAWARRSLGDSQGARDAERKAERLD